MKKILVLTPRFPYPLHGGDTNRIYRLCESLANTHQLTLLSFCQNSAELERQMPANAPFHKVQRIHLPKWKSYLGAANALLTWQSLQLGYYRSKAFANAVARLAPDHDAVLCHLIRTAPYALKFAGLKWVELTDHIPLTYARSNALTSVSLSLRRLIYTFEKTRIESAIQRITPYFDRVTFVSEIDRAAFLKDSALPPEHVGTFGLGVELGERPFNPHRTGWKIAFIGTLKAMPNVDAISHFITEILPIVQRNLPQVSLKIVGPVEPGLAERFGRADIIFTGAVPSIGEATKDCVIGICPVRIGAGVQNKMLDYMSLGLTVVTSTIGAEGLAGTDGETFIVADNPAPFAEAIIGLLRDLDRREVMARKARQLIDHRYSWEYSLRDLPTFLGL